MILQDAKLELSETHCVKNISQEKQFNGTGLIFCAFMAKVTAQNKTSALLENSKLQITTCSTQINVNFLLLDGINIDYKNEILII